MNLLRLLIVVASLATFLNPADAADPARPNVVLIMADDNN